MAVQVHSSTDGFTRALRVDVQASAEKMRRLVRVLALVTLGAAVRVDDETVAGGRLFVRLTGVVLRTPVDKGRARAAWNVSVSYADTSVPPESGSYDTTREGSAALRSAIAQVDAAVPRATGATNGLTVWITNALPYIQVLEFGLYPGDGPRTAGGYSTQAPAGMLRLTVDEVVAILERGLK